MDIKKLIEEFKNISGRPSPLKAWNQGKILKSIKDNPEYIEQFDYIDFEKFVEQYLEITARTANKYLRIYEIWQSEEVPEILKKNKNMLLEHLYTLIKPENEAIRDRILEAMANMEEYFEKHLEKKKLKKIYREDDIIFLVKESFPDAEIEFYTHENSLPTGKITLNVEFEYESNNYIKHEHHREYGKKCHLIICWLNNWSSPAYYAHILSIKELLETGEINLHFFD
ncbi:MAG: hypothetical protein ACK4V0_02470 [Aphanizomenon sp.]|jgi:SepF-like predicted cell division protein (DUF552 family)